jgi:hypothetical protein
MELAEEEAEPGSAALMFSVAIVHSPQSAERRLSVAAMLAELRTPEARKYVAGIDVFPSRGHDLWENHQRAMAAGLRYSGTTHHVSLEDDLRLARNFAAGAAAALEAVGPRCVNFYANRAVMTEAREAGTTSWVPMKWGAWGPSITLPTPLVGEFLRWDLENLRQDWWNCDQRVGLWAICTDKAEGPTDRWWWCTAPSLVQHLGVRSTLGHNNPNRVARWFIEDGDPTRIDWTKGLDGHIKSGGTRHPWDEVFYKGWAKRQPWMDERGWRIGGKA